VLKQTTQKKEKKIKFLSALLDTVLWPDCLSKSKQIGEVISSFAFSTFVKKYWQRKQ